MTIEKPQDSAETTGAASALTQMLGMEDGMELMQAVEHYATAMKLAERYGNEHGDVDAANNAWFECKRYEKVDEENTFLRQTLKKIVDADWTDWQELADPNEFVRWAKARANHALHKCQTRESV